MNNEFQLLPAEKQSQIRELSWTEVMNSEELGSFKDNLQKFIDNFGHLSDSGNDFSNPTWKENPDNILTMIIEQNQKAIKHRENIFNSDFEAVIRNNRLIRFLYNLAA